MKTNSDGQQVNRIIYISYQIIKHRKDYDILHRKSRC